LLPDMDENFAQKKVELTERNVSNFSTLFYWLTKNILYGRLIS